MSNFFKLYINENTKIFKKKSTMIFIIILLLAIIGSAGMAFLVNLSNNTNSDNSSMQEIAKNIVTSNEGRLEELEKSGQKNSMEYNSILSNVETYKYGIENNIDVIFGNNNDWKSQFLREILNARTSYLNSKYIDKLEETKLKDLETKIDKMYNILKENNFNEYINMKIEQLDEQLKNKQISKEQRDIFAQTYERAKKYEIGKSTENTWKTSVNNEIQTANLNLLNGVNSNTRMVLSVEDKEKLKNDIILNEYRLENNIPSTVNSGNMNNLRSVFESLSEEITMGILGLFMVLTAGGILSREFSKGTIKLLMINPAKRWKVLLAKLLTIIVILVVFTLVLSLLTSLVGATVFSKYESHPYIEVSNGQVHSTPHFAYTIIRFLTYNIDIFIYVLLAMMISTITRSTSAAVGTSIFLYMGNSIIMLILNSLIKKEWMKFIPFNNMNLTNKIFSGEVGVVSSINNVMMNSAVVSHITVGFALTVLSVCAILMVITMFDSFNKRDIT